MSTAWVLFVAGAAIATVVFALLYRLRPARSYEAGRVSAQLELLSDRLAALPALQARLELDTRIWAEVSRRVEDTQRGLDALRLQADGRARREDELLASSRRIESVFAGSAGRGRAGEHALAEALRALPQDMVIRDLAVNGRVVEFGLRLGDGRTLPIDSKWPAAELLSQLQEAAEGPERHVLAREVEREVERRIREVSQYILAGHTTPYALVALPDPALACCTSAYREAQRRGVLLMSYSMAVPYLLALYRLHLEYAGSPDIERARARLAEVERGLVELDAVLEHKLARASAMAQNAYFEAKRVTARLRATVAVSEPGPEGAEP